MLRRAPEQDHILNLRFSGAARLITSRGVVSSIVNITRDQLKVDLVSAILTAILILQSKLIHQTICPNAPIQTNVHIHFPPNKTPKHYTNELVLQNRPSSIHRIQHALRKVAVCLVILGAVQNP